MKKQKQNSDLTKYIKALVTKAEDGSLQVSIASSENQDRDGDIIKANGWVLDNFIKNPVLLWGHNPYSPAIGSVKDIRVVGNELLFTPVFDLEDDFAKLLYNKYQKKILSAFSVGFRALEWNETDKGYIFEKQELLEISAVNVPANPDATVMREMAEVYALAKSKGYSLDKEAENLINKFHKSKSTKNSGDNAKMDQILERLTNIEYQINNGTLDNNKIAEGDKKDGGLSEKPVSVLNRRTDADVLRDALILLDKAVEMTLKNLKRGGEK